MTETDAQQPGDTPAPQAAGKRGAARFLLRTRAGRGMLAIVLLSLFAVGYASVATKRNALIANCNAAASEHKSGDPLLPDYPVSVSNALSGFLGGVIVEWPSCPCAPPFVLPSPCDFMGETKLMMKWLEGELKSKLASTAFALERFIGDWLIDGMVATMLQVLNQAELNLIDWWDTFWFYNLNPAMQDMTKQFSASLVDQVRQTQSAIDARISGNARQARAELENKARKAYEPSENAAVVATMIGGTNRAQTIGKSMQIALQNQGHASGLNKKLMADGTPNPKARGSAAARAVRRELYEKVFCDPDSNAGKNKCDPAAPARFHNIDTQITKQIFSKLTIDLIGSSKKPQVTASAEGFTAPLFIRAAEAAPAMAQAAPVDQGTTVNVAEDVNAPDSPNAIPETALTAMVDNLLGDPTMNPLPAVVLKTSAGQDRYLNRREFLAKYGATRSPIDLAIGSRMPGSQLGTHVKALREAAGVPADDISPNPSYREVMHAMTVDRFNSGMYGTSMISGQTTVEREKLIMDALYLMQLRDYYEILERQALTLAVQVSMIADKAPMPNVDK